jgi:cardiolipin synthase
MGRLQGGCGRGKAVKLTGSRYVVATTTVWSGASYIYTKDAVKILNQEGLKKNQENNDEKPKDEK